MNNLTKEECVKALLNLYENGYATSPKDCNVISQLIKEHFDNPPMMNEKEKMLKLKKKFARLYSIFILLTILSLIITIWLFSLGIKLLLTSLVLTIFFFLMGEACKKTEVKEGE